MHIPHTLRHRHAHHDDRERRCHSTILARSPNHHVPATCAALSDKGGGIFAFTDVTFDTMSYMNITACTATRNMHMPCHLRCRYAHHTAENGIATAPFTHTLTQLPCPSLSDSGGGLCAQEDVTFETMSHINIHACTATSN